MGRIQLLLNIMPVVIDVRESDKGARGHEGTHTSLAHPICATRDYHGLALNIFAVNRQGVVDWTSVGILGDRHGANKRFE